MTHGCLPGRRLGHGKTSAQTPLPSDPARRGIAAHPDGRQVSVAVSSCFDQKQGGRRQTHARQWGTSGDRGGVSVSGRGGAGRPCACAHLPGHEGAPLCTGAIRHPPPPLPPLPRNNRHDDTRSLPAQSDAAATRRPPTVPKLRSHAPHDSPCDARCAPATFSRGAGRR